MKKTAIAIMLALVCCALLCGACADESPAFSMIAGPSDAELFPFGKHQAVAMQYLDSEEVMLSLADASGVQSSIRFPCKRGNFCFIPSSHEAPEFLVYDASDKLLTWYAWKGDALLPLDQWKGSLSWIVKKEGLMLKRYQQGSVGSLEFVSPQRQSLLCVSVEQRGVYVDDVIWNDAGWILLLRDASPQNLYTVRKIDLNGETLWTLDFPEMKEEIDSLFPDGAGGLWLSYSPTYTGTVSLVHVSADGIRDREILLGGESRVKHLHASQTAAAGKVVLFGTSVAHSKGVYHAFALTVSSSGDVLDLDVRAYTNREDDDISVRQSCDGTVYVYSGNDENAPPLLVPFSSLRAVTNHGLSIYEE